MTPVTKDDLLAAITALGKEQPKRPVGASWETISDMAKRGRISRAVVRWRMQLAIERGLKVERFVGSDYDPTGRLTKQTWFRVQP